MSETKMSVVQRAAVAKNTQTFPVGSVIVREGETTTELYLLLKGKVTVLKGENPIAELSEPMTYFGEMSALLGEPRSATIVAAEECEFMVVPGDKVEQLIDVSPAVGKKILQTLAGRLLKMNDEKLAKEAEVQQVRQRAQEAISTAVQDYKRLLYSVALVYESTKLPQVMELLKFGKDSSNLANHSTRVDYDDRHFLSSAFVYKLHKAKQKQRG